MCYGTWRMIASNSTGPILRCSECNGFYNPEEKALKLNRQPLEPSFCLHCGSPMLKQFDQESLYG